MKLKRQRAVRLGKRPKYSYWILALGMVLLIGGLAYFIAADPIEFGTPSPTEIEGAEGERGNTFKFKATVIRIIDGDTFEARLSNGDTAKVRVRGIDSPERSRAACRRERELADEATAFASNALLGQSVDLIVRRSNQYDRFGRLLADVVLPTGQDFGALMMESRQAVEWPNAHDWCLPFSR